MARSKPLLTPELTEKLSASLRAGAYESVSAELAGVPYRTYLGWLKLGRKEEPGQAYRDLCDSVMQAKAHARFMAESHLRTKEPRYWLLHGPGKETRERPGWSATPPATARNGGDESQATAQFLSLMRFATDTFKQHPAARQDLVQRLNQSGVEMDDSALQDWEE